MSNHQQYPINTTAYATMDHYYATRFESYQHIGRENNWGGIPRDYKFHGKVTGDNYPKLSNLYKGEAAFYSKVCNKTSQ
jgi:hypothetical protein